LTRKTSRSPSRPRSTRRARELTAEAAQQAGYQNLTLLEEPQAALYSWIQRSARAVAQGGATRRPDPGDRRGRRHHRPVADRRAEREGNLELQRVAVGDHILLGGDNMDLALAYGVARKLAARARSSTPGSCVRWPTPAANAKETLLSDANVARCRWWCPAAAPS
jgi:molecular chaperone DnaK (HSP70)